VVNERHSRTRLANSIAHELSHLLLSHPPSAGFDPLGNRDWHQEEEDEADWLAGCLLAPRGGLIAVCQAP
jgi:Zn-dependent peptidase ImmA (M78 family)